MNKQKAFTLAEVLITLAIIGVVAVMTIPTLLAKINDIMTENQTKVFNAKLIKGLNLTKTAGNLNDTYTSTYDFLVNGLGKNLKMAKVCDSDHIRDCIPYDKIKFNKKDGTEDSINVADIKTANKLNLKVPYTDTAAFILADGTPAIVSYNLKCVEDPDKADTTINACLAGMYDLNGTRKPNKYEVTMNDDEETVKAYTGDIQTFNGASVGSSAVCLKSGSQKACVLKTATKPVSLVWDLFDIYPKTPSGKNDYWIIAQKYCEVEGGHLPSAKELATIAKVLYDDTDISEANSPNSKWDLTMKNKTNVYSALGVDETNVSFILWGDNFHDAETAWFRSFGISGTNYSSQYRNDMDALVICLE